ncbi:MAG: 50S ribosomal protein L30e [Desulfurococcales archaeon]|nr:50S ribosomal protein L30e [Desulfurococcales archaeon]
MSVSLERELRSLLKTGKAYLGVKQTLKALMHGAAKLVIIAENIPPEYRARIQYYAKLSQTPIIVFKGTSVDLGLIIGKPFRVSAIAVIDEGSSRILELAEGA